MDTKLLKQKILDLAIRGKLVPQDPNDEPASVLLEKIRREKQELIKQGKIKKDKNESTIFFGDDKLHYEKFADGTVKNIEDLTNINLPNSWKWEVFGNICNIARGGSPRPIEKYLTSESKDSYNWIKIGDTSLGDKYITKANQKIIKEGLTHTRYVEVGDFLLSNSMSFGRPYILKIDGCIHDGWLVIKNTYNVLHQDYLYYLLSSSFMYEQMSNLAKGSTVKNLKSDTVKSLKIPIPPLDEQQRIVSKIEELFARVDKIEEEKQSLLKLIDKAKDKVLDLAMKGKLVKQDPNDEPASVLLEKIFKEKKKLAKEGKIKLSKDELLEPKFCVANDYYQDNPIYVPMKMVCYFINGYAFKSSEFRENGIDIVRISDLNNGYVDNTQCVKIKDNKQLNQFELKNGDLCIAMSGATTGKTGIYASEKKAYINQRVGIIRPYNDSLFLCKFRNLFFDYKRNDILSSAYGGAQPNISSKKILEMKVPLFPPNIQTKIVNKTDFILYNLNKIKDSL